MPAARARSGGSFRIVARLPESFTRKRHCDDCDTLVKAQIRECTWARAAKLPLSTPPPEALAPEDWMRAASLVVIGVLFPDISCRVCVILGDVDI